jgi:hypothetical protein
MLAVPTDIPVTTPPDVIVATEGLLLPQTPPAVMSVRVVDDVMIPAIGAGSALTVASLVATQPEVSVYVIVVVPTDIPVTTPVDEPTRATPTPALDQVPPVAILLNVVDAPTHATAVPVMPVGAELTVTVAVAYPQDSA